LQFIVGKITEIFFTARTPLLHATTSLQNVNVGFVFLIRIMYVMCNCAYSVQYNTILSYCFGRNSLFIKLIYLQDFFYKPAW